jgi:CubicO group peptidase (beta-lactamase class C family)
MGIPGPQQMARVALALLALLVIASTVTFAAKAKPKASTAPSAATTGKAATPTTAPEPTTSSAKYFPADDTVRTWLANRVESGQVPGIVVGLLESDGTMHCVTYGKSGGADERPLDGNTVFEIGSVTKVFTATLLADMVRTGDVRLRQPVHELLPDSVVVPVWKDTMITLEDLVSQSSGLPRLPTNIHPKSMANPYADYTVSDLYSFLSNYQLTRAPGTKYEYSNLGMGLLGHALCLRAGKPYEALVRERVLDSLGLQDTRVTLNADQQKRFAAGHDGNGKVTAYWDLPTLPAAGALRSTANDMMRFLAAVLDSNSSHLSFDIRRTLYPIHMAGNSRVTIGMAWHRMNAEGAELIMHNGGTGGFRSFIGFDPAMRAGVVVLANGANEIDDIGFHLLRPLIPLRPPMARRVEVKVDSTRLKGLVGRYALTPSFGFTITQNGDTLFAQATNQPRNHVLADCDTGFFWRNVQARITFTLDKTGRATRLTLYQNGRETIAPRVE